MIKVHRAPEPAILEHNHASWTQALLNAPTDFEKRRVEKKYRHKEIKNALVAMFHSKCAYCESKISHIEYGHIEHFRPKSRFQKLTFVWTNLLLSCPVCNGSEFKGQKYPEEADGGPLINPCDDNPEEHFEFVFDFEARLTTVVGKTARGKITEETIGLNRHDLRTYRTKMIMRLYALALYAEADPYAQELLVEACQDDNEYAAFARTISI